MELLLTILAFLYACTGIIMVIGYIPTIRDLTKKTASANISSYIIWLFSSIIGFLYAILIVSDLLLEVVMGLYVLCNAIVLILSLRLKLKK